MREAAVLRTWFRPYAFEVAPVLLPGFCALLTKCRPILGCEVWSVIAQFLLPKGLVLNVRVGTTTQLLCFGHSFRVRVDGLCSCGFGRTYAKARGQRAAQTFHGRAGSFAAVAVPPFAGRLVRVHTVLCHVDSTAVATSLDCDPSMSQAVEGQHCWHVCRLHHRSRMLRGPESACERWGSLLHMLWDKVGGWGPHRMAARLFIREGGLEGSCSLHEEAVVQEMTNFLVHETSKNPFVKKQALSQQCSVAVHGHYTPDTALLRSALREADTIDREVYRPMGLPDVCVTAVQALKRPIPNGATGTSVLDPLPQYAVDGRLVGKNLARSVLGDRLRAWLQTDDAKEWRESRQVLFGAGGAEEDVLESEGMEARLEE